MHKRTFEQESTRESRVGSRWANSGTSGAARRRKGFLVEGLAGDGVQDVQTVIWGDDE